MHFKLLQQLAQGNTTTNYRYDDPVYCILYSNIVQQQKYRIRIRLDNTLTIMSQCMKYQNNFSYYLQTRHAIIFIQLVLAYVTTSWYWLWHFFRKYGKKSNTIKKDSHEYKCTCDVLLQFRFKSIVFQMYDQI